MNQNNYDNKVTIIIVTFHSNEIVENLIRSIDSENKILIIENSLEYQLKSNLEKKYKNVEVVIPQTNLGLGGGINLALSLVKTKYSLQLSPDVILDKETINTLLKYAEEIVNFSILAPKDHSYLYQTNMYLNYDKNKKYHRMKYVGGYAMLFNMKSIEKIGYFDEKIFLYFEEFDFCYRCNKANIPIYLLDEAKIKHIGNSSIKKEYSHEIQINRNWHYCWSKFYFLKKNYNYLWGIKETIPNLMKSLKLCFYYLLKREKKNLNLHKAELKGLISSYLLKKSSHRPKI